MVAQFAPMCAMADFEEASAAGFQHIYPSRVLVPLCTGNYQAHQQNWPERGVWKSRGRPERRSVSGQSAAATAERNRSRD